MLHRLWIHHRQRNKSSASHITLVIIKYHSKEILYIELECTLSGCSTVCGDVLLNKIYVIIRYFIYSMFCHVKKYHSTLVLWGCCLFIPS